MSKFIPIHRDEFYINTRVIATWLAFGTQHSRVKNVAYFLARIWKCGLPINWLLTKMYTCDIIYIGFVLNTLFNFKKRRKHEKIIDFFNRICILWS